MTKRSYRTLVVTAALILTGSAAALAAGPLRGKTYEGSAPSAGVDNEGHRQHTHATGNITLQVSGSGKSVTVRFSAAPVLYCNTQQKLHVQTTKPASISRGGSFRASVDERFAVGPGASAIVQVVSGQFSGSTVRGQIRTEAGECGGVASFSAAAR
jgi:hypothetical protein